MQIMLITALFFICDHTCTSVTFRQTIGIEDGRAVVVHKSCEKLHRSRGGKESKLQIFPKTFQFSMEVTLIGDQIGTPDVPPFSVLHEDVGLDALSQAQWIFSIQTHKFLDLTLSCFILLQ